MTVALDPWSVDLGTTALVEASAGTGKTHAISTLFVRLLLEAGLTVDRILVVTFTEAAAAELRERIRSRLHLALGELTTDGGDEIGPVLRARAAAGHDDAPRLLAAIRSFDIATISTIHGFCNGVLQRHAFETGVSLHTELIVDDGPMLDEIVRDHAARELYPADPEFVAWLAPGKQQYARWLRLVRLVVGHPDLPVDPATVDLGPLPDRQAYDAAYAECRRILLADDAGIRRLLTAPTMFKKYIDNADEWLDEIADEFRRADVTGTIAARSLAHFTVDAITKGTRKAALDRSGPPQHAFFDAAAALHAEILRLDRAYEAHELAHKVSLVKYARKEAPLRKRVAGVQSYDDLLQHLDTALSNKARRALIVEQLRARFGAALIDEFQDTDPVQYRIFKRLFATKGSSLLLIGDPKQAIYGFRGADVFAYLGAARDAGSRRLTMRHNWRSDPGLLAATAELFAVANPFVLPQIEFVPVEPRPGARDCLSVGGVPMSPFHLAVIPKDGADRKYSGVEAKWAGDVIAARVADDIARLLAAGARIDDGAPGGRLVHAGDIAVLTRRNMEAKSVQTELRRRGIPSVMYGDSTVFESNEARELAHVLAAVAEPTRTRGVRAALATEMLGTTATALADLDGDDDAWERWVDLFRRLAAIWHTRGFIQMFRAMLSETEASRRLLLLSDGERRMTNLLHLAELLHAQASEEHLGPLALLQWFDEQRKMLNAAVDTFKLRLERDDRAVQLITIHRSKGLEYPIVYCPFSWETDSMRADDIEDLLYHTADEAKEQRLDLRPKASKHDFVELAAIERRAEAHRLLYVALTRARHRCVVVWVPIYGGDNGALGRLLAAPTTTGHEGLGERIFAGSDDEILEGLRARGGGKWTVEPLLPSDGTAHLVASAEPPPRLAARRPRGAIDRLWRTSSFSNLASTQSVGGPLFVDFADARAHDEALATGPGAALDALWTAQPPAEVARITLADFPRGIAAGNFFHDLIEHLDFQCDETTRRQAVIDALGAHGFPAATYGSVVDTALAEIFAAPLGPTRADGSPVRLCDLDRGHRLDELEFLLPAGGLEAAIGRRALARVFQDHPEGLPDGYGDRVAALGFAPLRGFLKGFIDMVFVADDSWWVVDYKTNHVGTAPDDYARARLDRAMAEDHYILQYHLYTVALVRMLALRVPGFDYDRHFGGALYLFVRGMSPAHPTMGVWHERPPRARIEALSTLLELGGRQRPPNPAGVA